MDSPNGIYAARASHTWCRLAMPIFDVLNKEGADALQLVGSGCLDAPIQIPAGSVRDYGTHRRLVLPTIVQRTEEDALDITHRRALAARLIAEILSEENTNSAAPA